MQYVDYRLVKVVELRQHDRIDCLSGRLSDRDRTGVLAGIFLYVDVVRNPQRRKDINLPEPQEFFLF